MKDVTEELIFLMDFSSKMVTSFLKAALLTLDSNSLMDAPDMLDVRKSLKYLKVQP